MGKFRLESIAELSRQLAFSPHAARLAQLTAAEELLHLIDPARAYPPEFIVYRITGYRPKGNSPHLLTGLALQHDLGLLIEQVSRTLNLRAAELAEPVLSIDDVTQKFNVTSKTIQRWRRKGLPSRRLEFGDGKKRVGFMLSSVERFFGAHRRQLAGGVNYTLVSAPELNEIVRRARRMAVQGRYSQQEIALRIGRRLKRSPLTILHTLRKHDQEHPEQAVLPLAAREMSAAERESAARAYRRGVGLSVLARRLGRRRVEIYRAVLEQRIAKLIRRKMRFIDDPLYHGLQATAAMEAIASQEELGAAESQKIEARRIPRDLPPYLRALYETPLLTPARERALFLKFNFHKSQFVAMRRRLDPQEARHRDLQQLETHLCRATQTKNAIVRANLRLVVSIARKHLRPELSLMELVSDGNLTLMQAVESFDVHKGHRFSTYATLALMKGFARSVGLMALKQSAACVAAGRRTTSDARVLAGCADARSQEVYDRFLAREEVRQLLGRLNPRERGIVQAHFGLEGQPSATYAQVALRLGISKQRVRQIERVAIAKLRAAAD